MPAMSHFVPTRFRHHVQTNAMCLKIANGSSTYAFLMKPAANETTTVNAEATSGGTS